MPASTIRCSGDSYQSFARLGLSFQRSQNGGRFSPQPGPSVSYYKRLQSLVEAPAKETTFFDGIDTTLPGLYRALRKAAPAGAEGALANIDREIQSAVRRLQLHRSFRGRAPARAGARGHSRSGRRNSASIPTSGSC